MSLVFAVHSNSGCAELGGEVGILSFLEWIENVFPFLLYQEIWACWNVLIVTISIVSVFAFPTDALDWCWLCPFFFWSFEPKEKGIKTKMKFGNCRSGHKDQRPRGASGDTPKFTAQVSLLCSQELEENWKGTEGAEISQEKSAASRAAPEVLELHLLVHVEGLVAHRILTDGKTSLPSFPCPLSCSCVTAYSWRLFWAACYA